MIEWLRRPNLGELTAEFCWRLRQLAKNQAGACPIALTGGASATVFYDAWAAQGDADNLEFYWSDERVVPLDDLDSNFKLAADHWLRPTGVAEKRIHAAPVELAGPACAAAYAEEIRRRIPGRNGGVPQFPLIVLGLGEDGHTGSLFPGRDPYQDDALLVRAVTPTEAHPHIRITFTPQLINAAAEVWFLITGKKKAWAAEQLSLRTAPVEQVPALIADPRQTRITVFQG